MSGRIRASQLDDAFLFGALEFLPFHLLLLQLGPSLQPEALAQA